MKINLLRIILFLATNILLFRLELFNFKLICNIKSIIYKYKNIFSDIISSV